MISVPFSFRGVLAFGVAMIGIMLYYMYKNTRERSTYDSITGPITFIGQQYDKWPRRNLGKFRYIEVEGYPYVFEIFIGKDPGDFTPKFEQIDNLRTDDLVTIYFYETDDTEADRLNRFAQFIDKDQQPYFEKGNSDKLLIGLMIVLCVLLVGGSAVLWKKGKMPY